MGPRETRWLKRTVLIGLGGTGKEALLRVKKKYFEVFGEVPPLLKFLLIDTTPAATDSILVEGPDGSKHEVRLEPNEVLLIEARGASMLPKTHDEIREWFPPKADLKSNIISGAGQIRALGRMALFANAHSVYEGLRALLSQARDYLVERPTMQQRFVYKAYSPHLTLCVIGSLAGGTGSGIFLDVAMILRDILKDEDQLFGYFLLPDIYVNRPGTQNVEPNAYAALRELDYYMSLEGTHRYSFGGREIEVRKKPFDMVFLVNNRNRAGKTFNQIEDMAELLGLGGFLVSGPLGKEQADLFDNIVMQLTEQQGAFYGKHAHYASFGAAELRFRPRDVEAQQTKERAEKAVGELLSSDGKEWGTTQLERQLEDIVNATELPKTPPENFALPRPSQSRSADSEAWAAAKEGFRRLEEAMREQSLAALKKSIENFEKSLDEELDRNFRVYNLPSLKAGLERLRSKAEQLVAACKEAAENAGQEGRKLEQSFEEKLPYRPPLWALLRRAQEEEEPLVVASVLRDARERAIGLAQKHARWGGAQELVRALVQRLEKLNRLESEMRDWLQEVKNATDGTARGVVQDTLPFTVTLPPPYLPADREAEYHQHPSGDLGTLREKGLHRLCENPKAVLDEVFRANQAASLRDWLRTVQPLERGHPLRTAVEHVLKELDSLSAPAWDYQEAWLANPSVARREQVHIIGIEDKNDTEHPLLTGEFRSVFAGNIEATRKLAEVSTGDQNRIYLYKIEASIPAFTLQGIEIYRERYRDLSSQRSFHTDRELERYIPDLLPMPSREEALEIWTKGQIFNLIRFDEKTMTFQRRGTRDSNKEGWHELGRTLGDAFRSFQEDFFGFKELESSVKSREQAASRERLSELRDVVEQALSACDRRLQDDGEGNGARTLSDPDRAVLEGQVEVLKQWMVELENYRPANDGFNIPTLQEEPVNGAAPYNSRR